MAGWQRVLAAVAGNAEEQYTLLKYRLRERMGRRDPIMITPYRGFGTAQRLYLKGRVLEDKGIGAAADDDSTWDNIVNMYKRFRSVEIPYARVRARFQGVEQEVVADDEGYFDVLIEPATPPPVDHLWHEVELELVDPQRKGATPVRATGTVLIPPADAKFGVISDVDDTVIHTDAFSLLRMARTVFLGNARTRLPFKGVAAFYQALLKGHEQQGINPLFYVSNSPWNLYDLLSDFFNLHNIPIGPILFLRNWGFTSKEQLPTRRREHKVKTAHTILQLFPHLPFILVGDSGEQDPEIYHELVTLYPHRIRAVYIRNVGRDLTRPDIVRALAQKVLQAGSTMILADDTLPLAQHAAAQGWIAPEALPGIEAERAADSAPPSPLEQLMGEPGESEQAEAPTVVVQPQPGAPLHASVADGAIEQALKTGKGETPKAPTVIIRGDEKAGG